MLAMSRRRTPLALLLLVGAGPAAALTPAARAQVTLSVVDVTFEPPPHGSSQTLGHGITHWTMDALIDVAPADWWVYGLLCLHAREPGVEVHYTVDPNTGDAMLYTPGLDGDRRFGTFVSLPQLQFANRRFAGDIPVIYGASGLPGCGWQFPSHGPTHTDLSWLELPLPDDPDQVRDQGAIARLTIDTSESRFEGLPVRVIVGDPPAGLPLLAEATVGAITHDMMWDETTISVGFYPLSACTSPGCDPGDFDRDCDVDLDDLAVVLTSFGATGADPNNGDLDRDGDVDLRDLAVALAQFGNVCDGPPVSLILSASEIEVFETATASLTVALAEDPGGVVDLAIERRGGDASVHVAPGALRFDRSNYATPRQVVITAGDDSETGDGQAMVWFSGAGLRGALLSVLVRDNDRLLVSATDIQVDEGATTTFTVALSGPPPAPSTINVTRTEGDTDLTVESGAALVFDADNFSNPQTVTIHAAEDADFDNGLARFSVSGPGFAPAPVTARERDDDHFIVSHSAVSVPEGGTAPFDMHLRGPPEAPVTVSVASVDGDPDIFVLSGDLLVFDGGNYDVDQEVVLAASEDVDIANGVAIVRVTAPGYQSVDITATEVDDDTLPTLHVDAAAAGANNGVNWADAYRGLREALEAARSAGGVEEIRVAGGVYTPAPPGGDREQSFRLTHAVRVRGGFAGSANPDDPDARDITLYPTILSGDLNGDDATGGVNDNAHRIVVAQEVDTLAALDGLVIEGARGAADGAGLRSDDALPTLVDCVFRNNVGDDGGAIYCQGSLWAIRCVFENNAADRGGVCRAGRSVYVNCVFNGNEAETFGGVAYGGSPEFINCKFVGNRARFGAACYVVQRATLIGCAVVANATSSAGGSAVQGDETNRIDVDNCIVWSNSAAGVISERTQVWTLLPISVDINYSCIQGWSGVLGGLGNIGADPLFVDPLGPDGIPGTLDDDLRLGASSPCIDAANNAALPNDVFDLDGDGDTGEPIPLDLAGLPRRVDDPARPDSGAGTPPIVDMGAYEFRTD